MNDGIQNLPPLNLPPLVDPPTVILVPQPIAPSEEEPPPQIERPPDRVIRENPVITIVGWGTRLVIGVFMIANVFPLCFITAIAAFGWLQRRMQAIALRGWWRESPRRFDGTFQAFCDSLGS